MRLVELLAYLDHDELTKLAKEHIREVDATPDTLIRADLESVLRSFRFIQELVLRRQPPTFSLLSALLVAPGLTLPIDELQSRCTQDADEICRLIDTGEVLARDDGFLLYRRILYEARRGDLDIDASEAALLGVVRRELGISQVEHLLVEYHSDLREFWSGPASFDHELNGLCSAGLLFRREGSVRLAEDVAPMVWQALGVDMPTTRAKGLFSSLAGHQLHDALATIGAKTSGSKEEKVERLLTNRAQPRAVLRELSLESLRQLCRSIEISAAGAKGDLVERIVGRFSDDTTEPEAAEVAEVVNEDRALDERRFARLFESLSGRDLANVLAAFPELRQSGSKSSRVATLWGSGRSEVTLLSVLMNRDLEDALYRLELKTSGSKRERIARLIEHIEISGPGNPLENPGAPEASVGIDMGLISGEPTSE
jgi:ribosomal protein L12E/L44/L45/RPP1/RPP2